MQKETEEINSEFCTNQSEIEEDVLFEQNRVRNKVGKNKVGENGVDENRDDILEIVGLTKIFNSISGRKKIIAVHDVTLGIHRGEVKQLEQILEQIVRTNGYNKWL